MTLKATWTYLDFSTAITPLIQALSDSYHATEVVLEKGGDSWTVGNTINASPYTADRPVVLEVTAVDGGTITALRIKDSGVLDGTVAEDGWKQVEFNAGTSNHTVLRFRVEPTGWSMLNSPVIAQTPMAYTLAAAGTGYAVNNKVYVAGASAYGGSNPVINSAFFNVDSVNGSGAITSLSVFDHPSSPYFGVYENLESGVHDLSGGTGSKAQVNLTIPVGTPTLTGAQYVFGSSGGAKFSIGRVDDFLTGTYFSAIVNSFPSYDGTVNVYEQTDVTPGYNGSGDTPGAQGTFMHGLLSGGTCSMVVTTRSVIWTIKNDLCDWVMYAGFSDPYTISTDNSFPMVISATGSDHEFTAVTDVIGGPTTPTHTTAANPPGQFWDGTAWQGFSNASNSGGTLNYASGATSGYGMWPHFRPTYATSLSVGQPSTVNNSALTGAVGWVIAEATSDESYGLVTHPAPIVSSSDLVGELQGIYALETPAQRIFDEDHALTIAGGPSDWSDYFDSTQHTNALGMSGGDPNQINSGAMLEIKHTDANSPAGTPYTNLHLTRGSRIILRDTGLIRSHESAGEYFAIVVQDPDTDKADFNSTITMPIAVGSLTTHFLAAVYWENQSASVLGNREMGALLQGGGGTPTKLFTGLVSGNVSGTSVGAEIPIGTLVIEYGFDGKLRVMYNDSATYLDQDEWISYDDWSTTGTGFKVESVPTYTHDRLDIALTGNDAISLKDNQSLFSYDRNGSYSVKYHLSKQTGHDRPEPGDIITVGEKRYEVVRNGSSVDHLTLIEL